MDVYGKGWKYSDLMGNVSDGSSWTRTPNHTHHIFTLCCLLFLSFLPDIEKFKSKQNPPGFLLPTALSSTINIMLLSTGREQLWTHLFLQTRLLSHVLTKERSETMIIFVL